MQNHLEITSKALFWTRNAPGASGVNHGAFPDETIFEKNKLLENTDDQKLSFGTETCEIRPKL